LIRFAAIFVQLMVRLVARVVYKNYGNDSNHSYKHCFDSNLLVAMIDQLLAHYDIDGHVLRQMSAIYLEANGCLLRSYAHSLKTST
jgi:hypothetical protein